MIPKWQYFKGNYRCPTPKCHYIATKEYVLANSFKTANDRNLKCPRCDNAYLVGYIGST